jgi:hypothetical protein
MRIHNELLIIVTIAIVTGTPLLSASSGVFIGYKCGEGDSKIAYQHNQCPNSVIEHRVLIYSNGLIRLIASTETGDQETAKLLGLVATPKFAATGNPNRQLEMNMQEQQDQMDK